MATSVLDSLASALAPVIRDLSQINIDLMGTSTQILRLTMGDEDSYGYSEGTYHSEIINNVVLKYPLSEVEIFDETENQISQTTSLTLQEILPIEMIIPFTGTDGIDPIGIEIDDIIVDVLKDEHGNKIPMVLSVKKIRAGFFGKYLVRKIFELSVVRGVLATALQTKIDAYVAGV